MTATRAPRGSGTPPAVGPRVLFHTVQFFGFFAVVWLIARVLPHRAQNVFLVLASYVFYATWDPRFLALVMLSTSVDFVVAQRIRAAHEAGARKRAFRWAAGSITYHLTVLCVFKYHGFFTHAGGLALPVGISFYTFQSMAYVIDVYRRRVAPVTDPVEFALFVAFFPQLLAGPIERAAKLIPQIRMPRRQRPEQLREGALLILSGLVKKLFIADNLVAYTRWGLTGASTGFDAYLVCIAFAIRIYCDFAGYTDMARGFAKLLGFDLALNFDRPFFASSPASFWMRWHISLTRWITDYLYGPLRRWLMDRGIRRPIAIAIAIMVGRIAMGIWHKATLGYVLWGALWGVILVIARPFEVARAARGQISSRARKVLGALVVFHLFAFTLVLTTVPLARCLQLWTLLASGFAPSAAGLRDLVAIAWYIAPLVVVEIFGVERLPVALRSALYAVMLVLLVSGGSTSGEEFVYYAF